MILYVSCILYYIIQNYSITKNPLAPASEDVGGRWIACWLFFLKIGVTQIKKTFGCVRFVYNQMLAERKEQYKKNQEDKEALKKLKTPTPAKYKKEYPWLKEVDSLALANAQLNLNTAYRKFFRNKASDFPKFKSKRHDKKSYATNNQRGTIRLIDAKTIRQISHHQSNTYREILYIHTD